MPTLSARSLEHLGTCCDELQRVARRAIAIYDFTVLEGHRGKDAQDQAVAKGLSQVAWPNGKHNKNPSDAMDVAPFPIDWSDKEVARQRFCLLAGVMLACAAAEGVTLRWGGDWDRDGDTRDERFRDLPHFEVVRTLPTAATNVEAGG